MYWTLDSLAILSRVLPRKQQQQKKKGEYKSQANARSAVGPGGSARHHPHQQTTNSTLPPAAPLLRRAFFFATLIPKSLQERERERYIRKTRDRPTSRLGTSRYYIVVAYLPRHIRRPETNQHNNFVLFFFLIF